METLINPNDVSAERALLSIILLNQERVTEVIDLLAPADFYLSTHQDIWKAITELYRQGQEIDIVSIKTELRKINIDPKPAVLDLTRCYEDSVFAGNLLKFVQEIKNKSLLRDIIIVTQRHRQNAQLEGANATEILSGIERDVVGISDQMHNEHPTDAKGILTELEIDIAKGQESGWKGLNTGFMQLDESTGGFIPTQCWIVGAYTGIGKTFFLLQLILNILEQGGKVMLFSTEMDRKMTMMRLLGNYAGVGTIRMLKGQLDETEKAAVKEARIKLEAFKDNLQIYDNVYTVDEIRLKAKKQKLQSGLNVVFIDFIQNLRGADNIYERMSNAAISLQQLAQELTISVVIASQVAQTSAGWESKEVIEYKGAGEIAAIADVGLWIKKVKEDKSVRHIVVRKVRHGIPNIAVVRISFPSGRMIDMGSETASDAYGAEGTATDQL